MEDSPEKVLKIEAMVKYRRLSPNWSDAPKGLVFIPCPLSFFFHLYSRLRLSLYIVSSKGFSLGWPSQYEVASIVSLALFTPGQRESW